MALCLLASVSAWAEETVKFQDVYLTQDRVCRACRFELLENRQTRLTNREGHSIVVSNLEVLGIDAHPFWRKTLRHIVGNTGLTGRIITSPGYDPLKVTKDRQQHAPPPDGVTIGY